MSSTQNQYCDEMKRKFGYFATWNPGVPLRLGDIGTMDGNIFTRKGTIKDVLKTDFEIREDKTKSSFDHQSEGSVKVTTKIKGSAVPQGSILTDLDAGIIVEFSKEKSTLFRAKGTVSISIEDTISLGTLVLEKFKNKEWEKKWVIITELIEAESATIIISNQSNSKVELKATANIGAAKLDIADAGFDFSIESTKGVQTNIIAEEGLTPLFKIMGVKSNFITGPVFRSTEKNLTESKSSDDSKIAKITFDDQELSFENVSEMEK